MPKNGIRVGKKTILCFRCGEASDDKNQLNETHKFNQKIKSCKRNHVKIKQLGPQYGKRWWYHGCL
jgi:hypothetical protein